MTVLPSGWVSARLADVADVRLGRQRSPKRANGDRMRPYLRAANVTWVGLALSDVKEMDFTASESETYELRPGDLLLSEASGSPGEVGKPAQYRGQIDGCCFQNTLLRVRLPKGLSPDFYEHYFREQALNGRFAAGSRGVGIHHLGAAALSNWVVPIPPADEQERIVAAIEEAFSKLDAGEAGLRAVRQRLKRMRGAVLSAAVGRPRTGPNEADGWAVVALGDVLLDIETGKSFATSGQPARPGEVGVIKVSAMTWGWFDASENKALPEQVAIDPRWTIKQGDLLVSRANTSAYVGACVLVESDYPNLILSDKSLRLVPTNAADSRWLLHCLRSQPARAQIERLATGTKESMRNISQEKLRGVTIPLPPLEEQRRLVAELERQFSFFDACERAVEAGLVRSAALRRSILKAAFDGKLVPQDPSDEPASVLLDRIRASDAPPAGARGRRPVRHTPSVSSET